MIRVLRATVLLAALAGAGCSSHVPTKVFGEQVNRTTPATAALRGIVHDAVGTPKPGATVWLDGDGSHYEVVADSQGAFSFTGVKPGTWTLVVRYEAPITPQTGAVQLGAAARSSRKIVVLHPGDNFIDASLN